MENKTIELEIISPDHAKKLVVEWVEIESPSGSFLVGPDHSPLVSMIKAKSFVTYKEKDEALESSLDAPGGIFQVANNKAKILLSR